ncbi:class I SAM-dependent methyltransferase [Mycobacterium spongiae]|uniref:Methyltransferase domain-containing protein n=1 Tax=Mycobacterium spongiae TaxID=886343 RepID=A0A975JU89_9MYCO|nr:methyltransferase domain-containing protein [Mycobacterium spongiae]
MSSAVQPDFDAIYRGGSEPGIATLAPWDIGGPQPVVQELVAHGAVRGEVLDPGTGPGHHAIYYASKGYSATGIDASPAAIERARRTAETAGVSVDFQVADATTLDGLENRFDTVVDCGFYHVFQEDEDTQKRYAQALHRATKPGARLYLFEFGCQNVNGLQWSGLPGLAAENFERVLPASGWRIAYLGTTTYQARLSPEMFAAMAELSSDTKFMAGMKPVQDQLQVLAPLLQDHVVHLPFWSVHAARID